MTKKKDKKIIFNGPYGEVTITEDDIIRLFEVANYYIDSYIELEHDKLVDENHSGLTYKDSDIARGHGYNWMRYSDAMETQQMIYEKYWKHPPPEIDQPIDIESEKKTN